MLEDQGWGRGDSSDVRGARFNGMLQNLLFAFSSHLQYACSSIVSIWRLDVVSPIAMSRDMHANVYQV